MDPLSSIGLASNILQFVEFSVKLVSKGVEIYSSTDGAPVQHADLRASLDNLRELAAPFRQRKNLRLSRDPDEIRIVQTAIACNEIAHDLEDALDGLVATPHSMTSSVLKALQSVWEQGKIDYMVGRLEGYRSDLQLMMINAVLNRQSFLQRSIDTLKSNNDELGIKSDVMLARVQDLKDELRDILHASQHSMPGVDATFLPHFTDNALRDKLGELYAEAQEIAKATDMLRSLRFHRMTLRRHNVADRHLTTLEWAYERHHEGQRLHFLSGLKGARGELQDIFRLVSEKSRTSSHPDIKFCFFVDGLDEYMGQSHEIAQAVQELSDTPNIKLGVSSRPWNTFEAAFGHDEKALLRVHEHNREDIRRYVHEILGQHRSFKQLVLENQEYQRVLHKIVSKAKGMFLWVFLVVRNMKESLPNEDTVKMMERIVDDFPSELEDYFGRMLDIIVPRYHEASSRILLGVMESNTLIPLTLVAHILPEEEDGPVSVDHLHSLRKLRARLKAYCGDLMTVVEDLGYRTNFTDCHERIDFLHRTVNDYLHSPPVKCKLQSRVPQCFNPSESIVQTASPYFKFANQSINIALPHPVVEIIISEAAKLEEVEYEYDVSIVDEVREYVVKSNTRPSNREFVKLALQRGFYSYIREKFKDMSVFRCGLDATWALRYVLFEVDFHGQQQAMVAYKIKPRMVRALLDRGANPNAMAVDGTTSDISALQFLSKPQASIWVNYVSRMVPDKTISALLKPSIDSQVFEADMCGIFVEHGADYSATLTGRQNVRGALQMYFGDMPREAERLELLARRWRRRGMISWAVEPSASGQELLRPDGGI
ncbi:hypothetical protein FPRO05_12296 [Fusarium proliferatum]|uniref:DUF7791 domain-containing protein n=1 Tax=Gibberella intermedia TaxID=948311 RepID=A0A365N4F4_GIBIN|nr:hypothetical protein FPRO05_12296 [Fusarium proliferatum]